MSHHSKLLVMEIAHFCIISYNIIYLSLENYFCITYKLFLQPLMARACVFRIITRNPKIEESRKSGKNCEKANHLRLLLRPL